MKIKISKNDIVYIDMDGVLVEITDDKKDWETNRIKKGFFLNKKPLKDAVRAFKLISERCLNVYILSTPVWDNVHCWTEKRIWVEKHLGVNAHKKLILTHNKSLNKGHILIDDSIDHGAKQFEGKHIHFGNEQSPNWNAILDSIEFI